MSTKGKKRAASEELKFQRILCEGNFNFEIGEAGKMDDPAGKLLRLEKIRQDLCSDSGTERSKINSAVKEVFPSGNMEVAIATALGLPTLLVGGFWYINNYEKRRGAFQDQLTKEVQGHTSYLSNSQLRVAQMVDAVLDEHMQEVTQSPLFKDVLAEPRLLEKLVDRHVEEIAQSPLCKDIQDEPHLLRQFTVVALKKGLSLPQEQEAADAATAAIEQEMAAPRKMHDYGGLNALRPTRRTI